MRAMLPSIDPMKAAVSAAAALNAASWPFLGAGCGWIMGRGPTPQGHVSFPPPKKNELPALLRPGDLRDHGNMVGFILP